MNLGTCIHYTGLSFGAGTCLCDAGVDLRKTFGDDRPGIALRMPCTQFRVVPAHGRGTVCRPGEETIQKPVDRRGEVEIPCALRQEPTAEQVEQDRIEFEQAFQKTLLGLKLASAWRTRPKPEKNRREVVECPACRGKLHLTQSSYNGHCHGKCETEGCVSWLE